MRLVSLAVFISILGITSVAAALQRGDNGKPVVSLQQDLSSAGYYDGPITGYYGESTEAAIRRFQRYNGLNMDGIAGQSTLQVLNNYLQSGAGNVGGDFIPPTLRLGSKGDAVELLQTRLRNLGYYDGPITAYYGDLTEAAVRNYQVQKGLKADGVVGRETWLTIF